MGRHCCRRRGNLRVECSSRFGQSENQKFWRRLFEEGNRENGSTLSWLVHVFTRPGPLSGHQVRCVIATLLVRRMKPRESLDRRCENGLIDWYVPFSRP